MRDYVMLPAYTAGLVRHIPGLCLRVPQGLKIEGV